MPEQKRGYLTSDFKVFHLRTEEKKDFDFHYHDFDKIIIFLQGNVTYSVEGKNYKLKPYDIVLVHAGQVHHPVVHDDSPYERIIIYISHSFINHYKKEHYDLTDCLVKAKEEHTNVFRVENLKKSKLYEIITELEHSFAKEEYARELYHEVLFLEFMIHLNRAILKNNVRYIATNESNEQTLKMIEYIEEHITEELSVDSIAAKFYMSRYYLMHLFKEETGDTIGNFIANKRLMLARDMIGQGMPVTEACYACGYRNYSTFSRAYKKCFGTAAKFNH